MHNVLSCASTANQLMATLATNVIDSNRCVEITPLDVAVDCGEIMLQVSGETGKHLVSYEGCC